MQWSLVALLGAFNQVNAILRFSCSQLVVERLDPLVNPGSEASPHLHQIVGGNAFNASVPSTDVSSLASCTTCTFADDFSNYWTAVMYYRAKNGSFKRIKQIGNVGFESAREGGMTSVSSSVKSSVTAFKHGFRMLTGDPSYRTKTQAQRFRQLTYTCLQTPMTRTGETLDFPTKPCPAGIMVNARFPTCWDGKNLDSPDHMAHISYPTSGTFESNGPCPATHPVKIPQLFFEVIWDTKPYSTKELWGETQPFVWSYGDKTGFGNHGDYVFGWRGDSLQKAMDANCNVNCPALKSQTIAVGNKCGKNVTTKEDIDGWLAELPGGMPMS